MAQENRATIKTYFETGDVPTQSQFGNSFDSQVFWVDDIETDLTSNSDSKVPTVKAVVDGIAAIPNPTLSDVLDEGNTSGTNDIIFDALQGLLFDNNSRLREGTTDAGLGGNKGVAQICGAGYELKWEAGRLYVMGSSGNTIRQSLYNLTTTPTATDDSSLGYAVGSLWTLDDGTTYECIDATATSADWIKTNQSKFIEVTKAQLLALEGAGTLSVNVWYKITDALGSTAKILVSATSVSIVSKSAVNLTNGTFGQYTLNADYYLAIIGTGDVVGPASSVNNQIALFDGTTGKLIKDSGVLLSAKQDTLTAGNMHTYVDSLTALTTPADADRLIIVDNSASLAKKITWANIKTTLASTFQAVLTATNFGAFLTALTAKNTLVDADEVLSSDSAASNVSKKTSWLNVWTNYIKAKADLVYSTIASPTFTGTVTTPAIIVSSETASRVAIIDASKNVKSGDTATYPSLTELAYVKGVTSDIQTQLNNKVDTFTLFTTIGTWAAPADSITYYAPIAAGVITPITTITTFLSAFTFATKIIGIYVQHLNHGGTQGSSQNVAIQLRNHTTTTSTQLINIQTNQVINTQKNFEDYSLNVAIAANDQIALQINTPVWTPTDPTQLVIRITLFFQRT